MTDAGSARPPHAAPGPKRPPILVGLWLLLCCALVFAMVVLGGLTRLTDSGLSIVEWDLLSGVLPLLSTAGWQEAFAAYRQFPEFQQINPDMTLSEFKSIYWLEYSHRLLGRAVGVVFLVPFLYFSATRNLTSRLALRLIGIFMLGGLQGALGWYMVQSGLVDRPEVSHYRLAAHLGLAVLIYGFLLRAALGILVPERIIVVGRKGGNAAGATYLAAAFAFLTMMSGALVAGLDAGLIYNSFPLMDGRWIPEGLLDQAPWFVNFGENVTTVQFMHRCLALASVLLVLIAWFRAIRGRAIDIDPDQTGSPLGHAMLLAVVAQVCLGVATLLYLVPLPLAVAHQAGAMVLLTMCLWLAHQQGQRKEFVL